MPNPLHSLIMSSQRYGQHREPQSFPTRRSSDLLNGKEAKGERRGKRSKAETGLDPALVKAQVLLDRARSRDRKSTRLNSSHLGISYAVFCLKKKKKKNNKNNN